MASGRLVGSVLEIVLVRCGTVAHVLLAQSLELGREVGSVL